MRINSSVVSGKCLWRIALVCALVFGYTATALAQACETAQCECAQKDMNPAGIMLGHRHPKGEWMFSYRYMYSGMKGQLEGSKSVSDESIYNRYIMSPSDMTMNMHMLMAMYGISDKLSVMAMLNYNSMSMNMNMPPGASKIQMDGMIMSSESASVMSSSTGGIGDSRIYAQYRAIQTARHCLVAGLGLNLPVGSIALKGDQNSMQPGKRLPYSMQLGSGTMDLLPSLTYLFGTEKLLWGSQLTANIRTGKNQLGYALGNELNIGTWCSYRLSPWLSASIRTDALSASKIRGKDAGLFEVMEPDANANNYGGLRLASYLGLNAYFEKLGGSQFSIEYGKPYYQKLNGPQLAQKNLLFINWGITI